MGDDYPPSMHGNDDGDVSAAEGASGVAGYLSDVSKYTDKTDGGFSYDYDEEKNEGSDGGKKKKRKLKEKAKGAWLVVKKSTSHMVMGSVNRAKRVKQDVGESGGVVRYVRDKTNNAWLVVKQSVGNLNQKFHAAIDDAVQEDQVVKRIRRRKSIEFEQDDVETAGSQTETRSRRRNGDSESETSKRKPRFKSILKRNKADIDTADEADDEMNDAESRYRSQVAQKRSERRQSGTQTGDELAGRRQRTKRVRRKTKAEQRAERKVLTASYTPDDGDDGEVKKPVRDRRAKKAARKAKESGNETDRTSGTGRGFKVFKNRGNKRKGKTNQKTQSGEETSRTDLYGIPEEYGGEYYGTDGTWDEYNQSKSVHFKSQEKSKKKRSTFKKLFGAGNKKEQQQQVAGTENLSLPSEYPLHLQNHVYTGQQPHDKELALMRHQYRLLHTLLTRHDKKPARAASDPRLAVDDSSENTDFTSLSDYTTGSSDSYLTRNHQAYIMQKPSTTTTAVTTSDSSLDRIYARLVPF